MSSISYKRGSLVHHNHFTMAKETISERWENLFNETNHTAMYVKHTSKTRKQHHNNHGPQNWKSTVFTSILHNFPHNTWANTLFISTSLIIHTDSISDKISSKHFSVLLWTQHNTDNTKRRAGRAGGPCCQMKNLNFPWAGDYAEGRAGRLHYRTGQWAVY